MKKQNGLLGLKDLLLKQFLFDDKSSDSVPDSLPAKERDRRKSPMGASFVNTVDFEAVDLDAIMSLEISSSKIVAMIGVLNTRKEIEILGFGQQILKNTDDNEVIKMAAAIRSAVSEAIELSGVTHVKAVYTNYSGTLCINRLTEVHIKEDLAEEITLQDIEILKEQMYPVISPPGEETMLIQLEHYTIDDLPNILNPVGMVGKWIEASFRAVGGDVSILRNLRKCISRADLHLTSAFPSAIASAEAVLLEEEKEGSIAIIDIGASMTHIAVFENGLFIYAETLKIGSNSVSQDIQQFTGLNFEKAEMIKRACNSLNPQNVSEDDVIQVDLFLGRKRVTISARELAYVIEARVEELVSLAYSKVVASLDGLKPDLGIVITGGGVALLPDIEKFVKQLTGVRCYVGRPDIHLAPDTGLPAHLFALMKSPVYATSVGLLNMGLNGRYYC